ncbi:hypothetical protein FQ775_19010 [Nitratireductor mangrovi]|uniref:Shikimate dehydrogenase substrate binding N-terminal domain-containing protein n=1 Tax=Nitratireductor mangrovi TaxID=2599600 RepID=A0A5B8L3E9_9HYPH|nr:hypothetical protein [Nitratireductor mangrovi]QDZ02302.2 hypothetical protein FQ775_19010 [Nitratireductor mangrovi]
MDFVDGRTRLYGIIGHPIEQARSPETVTFELRRRGVNAVLVPVDIDPRDFDQVFPQLLKLGNLDGLVLTIPHKTAAYRHLERHGPLARFSHSVSVMARSLDDQWIGEAFDGEGCVSAILQRGIALKRQRIQLLGAGGAGAAIAAALALRQPDRLYVSEPDEPRCETLLKKLSQAFPRVRVHSGLAPLADIDVLINASPIGMLDANKMPIEADSIPAHVAVMDAIMEPDRTKLLRMAEASGCVTIYGREMLDSQIAGACDFMLGAREQLADDVVIHT